MTLTGVPLIVVALVAMAVSAASTVLLWSRFGRWRLVVRTAGVLLSEALLVVSVGLVANRAEQFYPSWQALRGKTGAAAASGSVTAGRLDATLHSPGVDTLPWHPPGVSGWHLAAGPTLVVPAHYADRPTVTFPVVLDLAGPHRAGDTVTVHLTPSKETAPASLAALPADLSRDVRVTSQGWALVASMSEASFAAELIRSDPGRFVALALVGEGRPPEVGIAVAVVRTRPAGAAEPAGVTVLRGRGSRAWTVAADWAAGQTGPPLAEPVRLTAGTVRGLVPSAPTVSVPPAPTLSVSAPPAPTRSVSARPAPTRSAPPVRGRS